MQIALRYPQPQDAAPIFEGIRESIDELHRWMDWCSLEYSVADADRWIREQHDARSKGNGFEFVIVSGHDMVLGCCGINEINRNYRMANLGYWVRSSQTGHGVATEAARLTAAWAFENTSLERLEIIVAKENTASQRVAEKTGAEREGVLRSRLCIHGVFHDAVMHSIIRSTFRNL